MKSLNSRLFFAYTRVSTQKQGVEGVSLEAQQHAIQEYAARLGFTVTHWFEERETADGPLLFVRVIVRVERDSQKGIVIGRGGAVLKAAGTAARHELEALLGTRVHLETRVKVDPDWQRRAGALDRLGL